ncbi:pyruvate formate lyase activating enzyme [Methanophagales archaeon]|nr:pyruvate formate lyase activating enzyme [Methanophagales archaeon]
MKISYLSLSERRCTIQFYGCNFKCKACFAQNKTNRYTEVTPVQLITEIKQFDPGEVMLAGGEPTLYRKELIEFIKMYDRKTILTTNGSLLDGAFISEMENTCLNEIHIDLKAFSTKLHEWYTGCSNQMVFDAIALLNMSDLDFEVMTVFIPGIIDTDEIEKIAEFIAGIGNKIRYKIIRYVPIGNISRRPTEADINGAVTIAKEYLSNVTSSLEERTHPLKSVRVRI